MKRQQYTRITSVLVIISLSFGVLAYRLFILAYLKHPFYSRSAQAQSEHISNVLARGTIYFTDKDETLTAAAVNKKFPVVSVTGSRIDQARVQDIGEQIARAVDLAPDAIMPALRSVGDGARIIPKRLTPDQVSRIKDLHLRGVDVSYQMDRFYPNDQLAADVLGFLGYGENGRSGQYGVEAFYDADLFGRADDLAKSAKAGIFAPVGRFLSGAGAHGSPRDDRPEDIVLTIDKNIQAFVETRLDEVLQKWNAASGSVIVEDPVTGKILAMADRPSFNPNDYGSAKPEVFLNASVQQIFEPGSSFKPVTMAAGLDLGDVAPDTTYQDTGSVDIDGYVIKNFNEKSFGVQTMTQVLQNSLNTGTMFVENKIGNDNFLSYVINTGFGQRTGIDLPGEVSGDITNLYSGRKINYLTASFGQGIAVTPLQLVGAYAAIANGGKLMRPYVVAKIITEGGAETVTKPEISGIPFTEKTAAKLRAMLVNVVEKGFDKARIKGYALAGKTGTAQIPDSHGGYLEKQYIHTFAGFGPADAPRFVILIKMERPQGITFAADSLSPVFRDIAGYLINYYAIPPSQ